MEKVHRFLYEAKVGADIYKDNIEERLNVCLGNVSCDMDSAIGAIILAYYMSNKAEYYKDYGNYEIFWIPVINCPRAEVCARIDLCFHLKSFGVDVTKLVFIDDLDLNFYSEKKLLSLAMVDHNKLDFFQQQWAEAVTFIVDHHIDLKEYPNAEKILAFCGSACSQVVNLIFENNLDDFILDKEACQFFASAILIDTENFKPSLKGTKWGEIDELAFMRMSRVSMRQMYDDLINKKTDKKMNIELGLELMMKKDYKNYEWKNCIAGISVCFNPLHEIMSIFGVDDLKSHIQKRLEANGLNIYMMMTQTYLKTGDAFREIMIYDNNIERLAKVSLLFEKSCTYPYMKKKFTGLGKNFSFYYFKDESVSRKKVEPIFKDIFESL